MDPTANPASRTSPLPENQTWGQPGPQGAALPGWHRSSGVAPENGEGGQSGDTPQPPPPGLVELPTSQKWNPRNPETKRKTRLSRMRRAVLNSADLVQLRSVQVKGYRTKAVMLTLTYRDVNAWSGRHVSTLVEHLVKYLWRKFAWRLPYVWVAELQKRGAVHYHLVLWLPKGVTLPKPDKQGWWTHGSTRIEWARKGAAYLAKYASKLTDSAEFPRGLRLHGRGGLQAHERENVSWWLLPRYQRERCEPVDRAQRCPGGGWWSKVTGEWWPPWEEGAGQWA